MCAAVCGLALSACLGGSPAVPASCAGEWFAVGDDELSFVGKGGSASDSYVVTDLVLRNRDGERVVISMYEGATLSLPPTAMDGYAPWNGQRVEVVDAKADVPDGSIGPCARFDVSPLPEGWHPPAADDAAH